MKEDILNQIRNELNIKKGINERYNDKLKRIKELEKDSNVKEYISLIGLSNYNKEFINDSDNEIIRYIYTKYICKIMENTTNKIYVYLGTFKYSNEFDGVHSYSDIRIDYNDKNADYRLYQDIELLYSKKVAIKDCNLFEKNNIVINPHSYYKMSEYYKIQREFFINSVKDSQENAKTIVLKKYSKL